MDMTESHPLKAFRLSRGMTLDQAAEELGVLTDLAMRVWARRAAEYRKG